MSKSCKHDHDCTIIGKEYGITFFHIEKKELLLQNEITSYAARNKCIQTIGTNTGKQRIQYNRFQSYRLYRCFRFCFCRPLMLCRNVARNHPCVQPDMQRHK